MTKKTKWLVATVTEDQIGEYKPAKDEMVEDEVVEDELAIYPFVPLWHQISFLLIDFQFYIYIRVGHKQGRFKFQIGHDRNFFHLPPLEQI